jgi:folate-binding protein YgfZ
VSKAPSGYDAAVGAATVFDRSARTRLRVRGRAPAQMLHGILTGTVPAAPTPAPGDVLCGTATYHAVLTPKGKMITDLWCLRLGEEEEDGFLLDAPAAGREGLIAHLTRLLPPRMAKAEDATTTTAMITVVGPSAASLLSRLALGLRVETHELSGLAEGEWCALGPSVSDGLVVMRTCEVWPEAFDVTGPSAIVAALARGLAAAGAPVADVDVWTTLRVEAGRPEYGVDMDEDTIPVEAAIHERAIDYEKGCYTGQEVIVRIRDRGHVNRTLRLLHLGDVRPPARGTDLFEVEAPADARPVGVVTSAVRSPKYGETLALAYLKRGVEPPVAPR